MRPSFYSECGSNSLDPETKDWHFDGENLHYSPSPYSFKTNENNICKHSYFKYSFEYEFKYLED